VVQEVVVQGRRIIKIMLFYLRALLSLVVGSHCLGIARAEICSLNNEDCSHTGCCVEAGHRCYKKDEHFAGCRSSCTPGYHVHDPWEYRTPWSCEPVNKLHPDCAADDHHDCMHLGCCKTPGHKCYMKTQWNAFCRASKPVGWLGHTIKSQRPGGDGQQPGSNSSQPRWREISSAHYWDCNGQSCDVAHLQPWNASRFVAAPEYAPMDPEEYGGNAYGEKIWMTGAVSDAVSRLLGPDANNCGSDSGGGGGCGQCMLIHNPDADKNWTAVVMKKKRCDPWDTNCGDGRSHLDVAVPGFDRHEFTGQNVCGKHGTSLSKHQASSCAGAAPRNCDCSGLPERTKAQKRLKAGCEIFKAWGWLSGTPKLKWQTVPCPSGFIKEVQFGKAFGPAGPISVIDEFTTDPNIGPIVPTPTPAPPVNVRPPNNWAALINSKTVQLAAIGAAFIIPGLAVLLLFHRQQRLEKRIRRLEHEENPDTEALLGA